MHTACTDDCPAERKEPYYTFLLSSTVPLVKLYRHKHKEEQQRTEEKKIVVFLAVFVVACWRKIRENGDFWRVTCKNGEFQKTVRENGEF